MSIADLNVGVVVIGRNEGERLIRCLHSLQANLPAQVPIVYVDSGSTDSSVAEAYARGVQVVELDMSVPFTGARARNAGFQHLMALRPQTQYVQFIDGDCELLAPWMPAGLAALEASPKWAVVFGRLRERFPEASPYNQIADLEWQKPLGEAKACGGIALMRTEPLQAVGGFRESLICGEEPELCIRLRRQGWQIHCIDADMAFHDINMHRFGQWWKRSLRGGWAIAEGAAMYGAEPEQHKKKENVSGWLWGALLPVAALCLVPVSHGWSLLVFAIHGLLLYKIYRYRQQMGDPAHHSLLYAFFCVLSKVPQVIGQGQYWLNRWQQKPATLIEYKG